MFDAIGFERDVSKGTRGVETALAQANVLDGLVTIRQEGMLEDGLLVISDVEMT